MSFKRVLIIPDSLMLWYSSYLLRLLLVTIRNMSRTLAPMPSPATRKIIPAACSAFSLHSMVVPLVAFRSCSPTKMPAPGIPRDMVLPREDIVFNCAFLYLSRFEEARYLSTDICLFSSLCFVFKTCPCGEREEKT